MRKKRLLLVCVASLVALRPEAHAPDSSGGTTRRPLTFEDRVAAQRAIEEVYWRHRSWPSENSTPKPAMSDVVSARAIRAKVEEYLRKSVALETIWNHPIAAEQLQAEMNRIAMGTKSPELLRELFEALESDPHLIAETLARSSLVDRLVRNAYARDDRFHGARRAEALATLEGAQGQGLAALRDRGAAYGETRWIRVSEPPVKPSERGQIFVASEEWQALLAQLGTHFVAAAAPGTETLAKSDLPVGGPSRLEETNERFQVMEILDKKDGQLTVAVASWPKTSFDAWWQGQASLSTVVDEPSHVYVLPTIAGSSCVPGTWTPTALDLPGKRAEHTAIWTGTEMIVWGGWSETGPTSTGLRYDPATDTWRTTSREGAPAPRTRHTAVWTGSEMIIWGGTTGAAGLHGGRYDPLADRWTSMSLEGSVGDDGDGHTALWTGSEMVVWADTSGARYVPSLDQWRKVPPDPALAYGGRRNHTAVWTGSEMILWGGYGPSVTNAPSRWKASTNTWSTGSSNGAPEVRSDHSAVWTGTEMIVWGFQSGGRYNPTTDRWLAIPPGPSQRWQQTAVWTGSEMIVWGGRGGINGDTNLGTGARYSPLLDTWVETSIGPNAPTPRWFHTAVWTGSEMIVWGGSDDDQLDTGARYTPASDSWMPTSVSRQVPSHRSDPSSIWTGSEMIVWGGYDQPFTVNTGGRYDPVLDTWTPTSTGAGVPSGRTGHTAVWTGLEMIVWGGSGDTGVTKSGGRYSPVGDTWIPTSRTAAPAARSGHTAVWTGVSMVVWGGSNLATGGRYTPSSDSWLPTSTSGDVPSGRSDHTAVWTGSEMIVWGGFDYSSSDYDTGGRYDPVTDVWRSTPGGESTPAARFRHSAIWTGSEMIVWGGFSLSPYGPLDTGARYTPATDSWKPTSTLGFVPSPRSEHTAVWSGREMIVWGGLSGADRSAKGGRYNSATDSWTEVPEEQSAPVQGHTAIWTGTEMVVWGSSAAGGRYCASAAADSDDFDPPTLLSFDFAPRSVDVTRSGANVTCTLSATDLPAGVASAYCSFESPIGELVQVPLSLVSGAPDSGTWQGEVGIPYYGTPGVWRPHVWLYDANNNARHYTPQELGAAGWQTDLEVIARPSDVMWVDCVHGDDNDPGTEEKPKRTLGATFPCEECTPRAPFELHIFPGVCPSEGGIHLPLAATVIGAGSELTTVDDDLLLAGTQGACKYQWDDEGPCSYTIRDLAVNNVVDGSDFCEGLAELTNVAVRGLVEHDCFNFGEGSGAISIHDSQILDLWVALAAGVDLRHTIVRGTVFLGGFEDIGANVEDCEIGHLEMVDKTYVSIERSRFYGEEGTAIALFHSTYGGAQLSVRDSFFKGFVHHIDLDCGEENQSSGCNGHVFERNTFVGARDSSIWLTGQLNQPSHTVIRGNAFWECGGAAITSLESQVVEIDHNNFDQVSQALCSQHCDPDGCDPMVCGLPAGNMAVSSGFVSDGDFRLLASSPLIDAGGAGPTVRDLDGLPRPADGNGDGIAEYDIGAYEFQGSGSDGVDRRPATASTRPNVRSTSKELGKR